MICKIGLGQASIVGEKENKNSDIFSLKLTNEMC